MDFEVVVGDPWFMDIDVLFESFIWWLDGVSAEEAVERQLEKLRATAKRQLNSIAKTENIDYADEDLHSHDTEEYFPLLHRNMVDQWRFFQMLNHYLQRPELMNGQLLCRVPSNAIDWMIACYYTPHDLTVRELLSKKGLLPVAAVRRTSLDDIADLTGLPLMVTRRHTENLSRVYNSFEDQRLGFQQIVFNRLVQSWKFPPQLAARYTSILFLFHSGFKIPSSGSVKKSKGGLGSLLCCDFEFAGLLLLNFWVRGDLVVPPYLPSSDFDDCGEFEDYAEFLNGQLQFVVGLELDKRLVMSLRDVKTQIFGGHDKETGLTQLQHAIRMRLNGMDTSKNILSSASHVSPLHSNSARLNSTNKSNATHGVPAFYATVLHNPQVDGSADTSDSVGAASLSHNDMSDMNNSSGPSTPIVRRTSSNGTDGGWAGYAFGQTPSRQSSQVDQQHHPHASFPSTSNQRSQTSDTFDENSGAGFIVPAKLKIFDVQSGRIRGALKGLLSISAHLAQLREFRDLLEDIAVRIVEPLVEAGLSPMDMANLFSASIGAVQDVMKERQSNQSSSGNMSDNTSASFAMPSLHSTSSSSSFNSMNSSSSTSSYNSNSSFSSATPFSAATATFSSFSSAPYNSDVEVFNRFDAAWRRYVFVVGNIAVLLAERLTS